MSIWKCKICGYIYDDSKEQVKFVDLPATWTCPKCGAPKDLFEKVEETPVVEKKQLKNI
jgi:rubredoxin